MEKFLLELETEKLIQFLIIKNLRIAFAESCTGGLLAKVITDISGSSNCFVGGYVAYSNYMKRNIIGVQEKTLEKYGAVSQEVALEMAECTLKKLDSDLVVSTTGFAGPLDFKKQESVGLVFVGIAEKKNVAQVYQCRFDGTRLDIRNQIVEFVIKKLLEKVQRI